MIHEFQIRVQPHEAANEQSLMRYIAHEKGMDVRTINAVRVLRRSIDARQRRLPPAFHGKGMLLRVSFHRNHLGKGYAAGGGKMQGEELRMQNEELRILYGREKFGIRNAEFGIADSR